MISPFSINFDSSTLNAETRIMDKSEIILIIVALAAIGFSLYRKYMKKEEGKNYGTGKPSGTSFQTSTKDDDYEPYSGK